MSTHPAADRRAPGPEGQGDRDYLRFVLVLGALIALGPLSIDMYLPAFPRIAEDLSATPSQVQLTLTGMLCGLALGQLVIGPLSDAFGRRRPLLVGLLVHAVASILCSMASTIEMLSVLRVLQGLAGASVSVTAMAMVRDRFAGVAMARLMARLILVIGLAPIIAPSLGGLVLEWTGWRRIFDVLALAALLLATLAARSLHETLPPERRRPARVRASLAAYGGLFRDARFLALALIGGSMMATLFAYVSGASFVLQEGYGLSERTFAIVFGVNAAGFVVGSQLNPVLLRRYSLIQVLTSGILLTFAAAALLLVTSLTGLGGLVGVLVPLGVVMSAAGLSMPNTPALALERYAGSAGTAAAVLGSLQFGVGAAAAPLVGAFGGQSATPMAVVMLALSGLAATLMYAVVRRPGPARVGSGTG
ncbi:multidrug effflux MFS transporter [Nocardioides donggukensis]|uniref:Multidrug effflux MFS transporter n=1 Tax=Nocardioides donggukensis TaxID=2774019 RepID=A0A927K4K1_9ACTN|nr:multidrug effflux MFS transporter [Nocardioides donggukensis]MBD8870109.1 multidrug effflux MFS transporter [Nocardioides donggukensis]